MVVGFLAAVFLPRRVVLVVCEGLREGVGNEVSMMRVMHERHKGRLGRVERGAIVL